MTPDAPARLAAWAGSLVRTRSRGAERVGKFALSSPRLLRDAAILVAGLIVIARATGVAWTEGVDFHAYWAADLANPYEGARSYGPDAFLYSPVFAQAAEPLRWLPFQVALALWTAIELACLIWLAGPWSLPLMLPLWGEIVNGNVHLVMAASVVLAFRHQAGWLLPAFTKGSPAIGLGWFALRGEWRYAGKALAILASVAAVSFVLAPHLWFGWFELLRDNAGAPPPPGSMQVPLVLRLAVASGLLVWGARTNRRWVVPLAVAFGLPVLWWSGLIAFGVAALYIRNQGASRGAQPGALSGHRPPCAPR